MGVYFPALGTLKSRLVPDAQRAARSAVQVCSPTRAGHARYIYLIPSGDDGPNLAATRAQDATAARARALSRETRVVSVERKVRGISLQQATIYNLFRLPLNVLVLAVILTRLPTRAIFAVCASRGVSRGKTLHVSRVLAIFPETFHKSPIRHRERKARGVTRGSIRLSKERDATRLSNCFPKWRKEFE